MPPGRQGASWGNAGTVSVVSDKRVISRRAVRADVVSPGGGLLGIYEPELLHNVSLAVINHKV